MSRRGYESELQAKHKLITEYGFYNVFKNAISNQGADYLVVKEGKLIKCVEVKECHGKKYYPSQQEKSQFARIKAFCDEHKIEGEIWIKYVNRGWIYEKITFYL